MSDVFRNFFGGKWLESESRETYERSNPADGSHVATYIKSSGADDDKAAEAAAEAFSSWRLYPAPKRGSYCSRRRGFSTNAKSNLPER